MAASILRFDRPILVFGGAYGNLEASRALIGEAARRGIDAGNVICTGDLIAYGADPAATIALFQDFGCHAVMGNCDEQLAENAADCACGYPEGSTCDRLSAAWFAHADRETGLEARAFLATLPRRLDIEIGGRRLAVVHGSLGIINRFVFASSATRPKLADLDAAGVDGIIGGHCGLPFTQVIDGRLWHNPGVIGMPAHDGTPRVWYSVLTPSAEGVMIEHAALDYDHQAAAAAMRRARLPEEYARALETGLWPSCDVLPYPEIRAAGRPLRPGLAEWLRSAPRSRGKGRAAAMETLWPAPPPALQPGKFVDPRLTLKGEPRAEVSLGRLETLWFNTGTVCNITCRNCYIESSPANDRLAFLAIEDVAPFLDEIARDHLRTREIGFTGGEPFANPRFLGILDETLSRGFDVLVLTNAMRPMQRRKKELLALGERHGARLRIRVSLDHYTEARHDEERGEGSFRTARDGVQWLSANGFSLAVAGRAMWGEAEAVEREGYRRLFAQWGVAIDADDPARLVLFPEMDTMVDVPEITSACWGILGTSPSDLMCASSRMVVKRKEAEAPAVLACTLIAYDARFELGGTLREASRPVPLNHPHCAKFCVLGGASCSVKGVDAALAEAAE